MIHFVVIYFVAHRIDFSPAERDLGVRDTNRRRDSATLPGDAKLPDDATRPHGSPRLGKALSRIAWCPQAGEVSAFVRGLRVWDGQRPQGQPCDLKFVASFRPRCDVHFNLSTKL